MLEQRRIMPDIGNYCWQIAGGYQGVNTVLGNAGTNNGFAPCSLQSFSGPSGTGTNQSYNYTLTWEGDVDQIVMLEGTALGSPPYTQTELDGAQDTSPNDEYIDGLEVDYNAVVGAWPFNSTSTPASTSSASIQTWSSAEPGLNAGDSTQSATFSYTPTEAYELTTHPIYELDPVFLCDYNSNWYVWGDPNGNTAQTGTGAAGGGSSQTVTCDFTNQNSPACAGPTTTGDQGNTVGPFPFDQCFTETSMTLYNPLSWVEGAVKFGVCALEWFFEPSFCNVTSDPTATDNNPVTNNCVNLGTGNIQNRVPIVYLTDSADAVSSFVSAWNTGVGTSACDAPSFSPFSDETTGVLSQSHVKDWTFRLPAPSDVGCTADSYDSTAGNLFGYRSFLRDLEELALLMGFVAFMWKMMPWSRRGDMDIFEKMFPTGRGPDVDIDDYDRDDSDEGANT